MKREIPSSVSVRGAPEQERVNEMEMNGDG